MEHMELAMVILTLIIASSTERLKGVELSTPYLLFTNYF